MKESWGTLFPELMIVVGTLVAGCDGTAAEQCLPVPAGDSCQKVETCCSEGNKCRYRIDGGRKEFFCDGSDCSAAANRAIVFCAGFENFQSTPIRTYCYAIDAEPETCLNYMLNATATRSVRSGGVTFDVTIARHRELSIAGFVPDGASFPRAAVIERFDFGPASTPATCISCGGYAASNGITCTGPREPRTIEQCWLSGATIPKENLVVALSDTEIEMTFAAELDEPLTGFETSGSPIICRGGSGGDYCIEPKRCDHGESCHAQVMISKTIPVSGRFHLEFTQ